MKKTIIITLMLMTTVLLFSGCSNRGIHMSKHRKSRKCNCPTFTQQAPCGYGKGEDSSSLAASYYYCSDTHNNARRGI